MENAKRTIPYIINLLDSTLSKEKKSLDEWNNLLTASDPLIARQAKGNISSNQERVNQLEKALLDLYPTEQREKDKQGH